MPAETELKFPAADLVRVRQRLQNHGAEFLCRHFERNLVFDTPERELRQKGVLLRLREADGALLTLKRPPDSEGPAGFKVLEELETGVQDFQAMRQVLEALGYEAAFAYEKLREEWRLEQCLVCLDRLPFGDCVELEAEPQAMEACAPLLGLELEQGSTATYHELHCEYREAAGLAPDENFVFAGRRTRPSMPWDE